MMRSRIHSDIVRVGLERHAQMIGRDCQCRECLYGRDLLDARARVEELGGTVDAQVVSIERSQARVKELGDALLWLRGHRECKQVGWDGVNRLISELLAERALRGEG